MRGGARSGLAPGSRAAEPGGLCKRLRPAVRGTASSGDFQQSCLRPGNLPPPIEGIPAPQAGLYASARGVLSRRDLLRRGLILAGVGLLGVGLWRFITEGVTSPSIPLSRLMQNFKSKIVPPPVPNYGVVHPAPFLSPDVTSNDQYYIVSKNLFADPIVDGNSWKLVVDGEVNHPFA